MTLCLALGSLYNMGSRGYASACTRVLPGQSMGHGSLVPCNNLTVRILSGSSSADMFGFVETCQTSTSGSVERVSFGE